MSKNAILLGTFVVVLVVFGVYLARRMRAMFGERADAERRGAEALAEVTRLSQELRSRQQNQDAMASLPPGERLRRQYPGVRSSQGNPRVEES